MYTVYIRNIEAIYKNAEFEVFGHMGSSTTRKQRSGIRQGCPLSPYLLIIVMHVLFYDLENKLIDEKKLNAINTVIDGLWDLEYADDTIFFNRNYAFIQAAFLALQDEFELYGQYII